VCFIDLRKCYDTVNRTRLFYELLNEFHIGGKFLKILRNIYTENQMYIKVDQGLIESFTTTAGCKQGDNLSPLLYNLLTNRLPLCFDESCDPAYIGDRKLHCLSWADDCILVSQSSAGLQHAINKAAAFFNELGLSLNVKKTQCMIFNKRGLKSKAFPQYNFTANGQHLALSDTYTYLGLVFVPSGASTAAIAQLHAKASRAYFSISNILYRNKKMPVTRALSLVDSLVFPVSFYAAEYLTPLLLPARSFSSTEELLRAWEGYLPERLNQRACRLLLSVHRKASRLAVLGELGRYPALLTSLSSVLKYSQVLRTKAPHTLARSAYSEMEDMVREGKECWLGRVESIRELLDIPKPHLYTKPSAVGGAATNIIQSKFDGYFLREINKVKLGSDGRDHNKLKLYASIKGCFKAEPYVELVSRNQRAEISRVRISAHRLRIETARYQCNVPISEYITNRCCRYCQPCGAPGQIDDEYHLFSCPVFVKLQHCLFKDISELNNKFAGLSFKDKVNSILCPTNSKICRLTNKYIKTIFDLRDKLDESTTDCDETVP
jgi:hypothetical protein